MWDSVAISSGTVPVMGYGVTRGALSTSSIYDRIHGVRFHAGGGSTRTFDPPTEILLYKYKES